MDKYNEVIKMFQDVCSSEFFYEVLDYVYNLNNHEIPDELFERLKEKWKIRGYE